MSETSGEMALLNPMGEELMILGANPRGRRRRRHSSARRSGRVRVHVKRPRRRRSSRRRVMAVSNPRHRARRHRSRRRYARNPVGNGQGFRVRDIPRYVIGGTAGAAAGGAGYWISKKILPAQYDRHPLGYAVHGLAGTGVAIVGAGIAKAVGMRGLFPVMVAGAWATVGFRILLNVMFGKMQRPTPLVPPTEAAKAAGLEGIEGYLSMAEDVDVSADETYQEEVAGVGQAYQRPEPYDVSGMGQAYQRPEPYDVSGLGQNGHGRRWLGQEYQPARGLPAASMPVGQMPEAPELGAFSRRAPTHFSPMWGG